MSDMPATDAEGQVKESRERRSVLTFDIIVIAEEGRVMRFIKGRPMVEGKGVCARLQQGDFFCT